MLPNWSRGNNYLDAIEKLGGTKKRIRTGEIAAHLDVTPASVTVMLQRLAEGGYVDRIHYHGVKLTRDGRATLEAWRERRRRFDEWTREHNRQYRRRRARRW